VKKDRL
jgi:hypothetical protein